MFPFRKHIPQIPHDPNRNLPLPPPSKPSNMGVNWWVWLDREFHSLGHDDWLRDVHVTSTGPARIFLKIKYMNAGTKRVSLLLWNHSWKITQALGFHGNFFCHKERDCPRQKSAYRRKKAKRYIKRQNPKNVTWAFESIHFWGWMSLTEVWSDFLSLKTKKIPSNTSTQLLEMLPWTFLVLQLFENLSTQFS